MLFFYDLFIYIIWIKTHSRSSSCSKGSVCLSLVLDLLKMLFSSSIRECLSVVQGTSTSTWEARHEEINEYNKHTKVLFIYRKPTASERYRMQRSRRRPPRTPHWYSLGQMQPLPHSSICGHQETWCGFCRHLSALWARSSGASSAAGPCETRTGRWPTETLRER